MSITLLDNRLGGIWFEAASRDDFRFKDFPQLLGRDWRLSLSDQNVALMRGSMMWR